MENQTKSHGRQYYDEDIENGTDEYDENRPTGRASNIRSVQTHTDPFNNEHYEKTSQVIKKYQECFQSHFNIDSDYST